MSFERHWRNKEDTEAFKQKQNIRDGEADLGRSGPAVVAFHPCCDNLLKGLLGKVFISV